MSVSLSQTLNKSLYLSKKTRMESLMDRIDEANKNLDSISNPKEDNNKPNNFLKKIEKMIEEINTQKNKSNINSDMIQEIISSLPESSIIQIAYSKEESKKENEKLKLLDIERNNYKKKLEDEIINQRVEREKLQKEESESLTKISNLEDEIRILKQQANFDSSSITSHRRYQTDGPVRASYDNLRYSNYENEFENKNNSLTDRNRLNNYENEKQMKISQSHSNINNNRNIQSYNFQSQRDSYAPFINELWSNRKINNNLYKSTSSANIRSNMRRITPMIFNNNINTNNQYQNNLNN